MAMLPARNPNGHHMKQRRKDLIFVLCMLAIPLANFLVFWLWPNFQSIIMAFQLPNNPSFTLLNFERFFTDLFNPLTGVWKEVRNSFIMFFVGTFVNLPMVLFMSYVMFKKVAGYKIFRILFYLPSIIGGTVMSQIFKNFCGSGGPIEQVMTSIGIPFNEYLGLFGQESTGMMLMIVYTLWTGVGSNMIMFTGAMNRVPQDVFESARIDGIGFFREFFNIIVPLIWPTVTTMVVFSMTGIFSNAGIVMLLCPYTPGCSNIGYYILRHTTAAGNSTTNEVYNYPAAVGLIFTAINLPLVLGTRALCEKVAKNVEY